MHNRGYVLLASSGVVSASNVEMLSRLCFCSMRCVRSSMDTVSISPILSALESSDKMLLYGVSKHLIGRLTRKPCRSLYGHLRHKACGQMKHLLLPGKGLRSEACLQTPMQATLAHNRSSNISTDPPLAYLPQCVS